MTAPVDDCHSNGQQLQRQLRVLDTASLLIGIVVGISIFKTPQLVFGNVPDAVSGLVLWGLGALFSLCGALCFSELATTYPEFGGEYQYLSQAYGRRTGFLFAWMQLCVILTGSIGAMAFVFADYASTLHDSLQPHLAWLAAGAVLGLALIQGCGFRSGTRMQNLLTGAKVFALCSILVIGIAFVAPVETQRAVEVTTSRQTDWGLALVFVLYAYGGWNDAAMVTPEVQDYRRNVPRAFLLGLGFVGLLYLLLNLAFLRVLGLDGVRASAVPAADLMQLVVGGWAAVLMSLIVMSSALGAIHGMLFVSCRLLAAVGEDYPLFRGWNRWNSQGVPVLALSSITAISLVLIVGVGTAWGRARTTDLTALLWLPRPDWDKYYGGFETLVAATAPVFWVFFLLSGLAVLVLRRTDPDRPRPFRVPWSPWPIVLFCSSAAYMLWRSLDYARELTLLSLPVLIVGILLSFTTRKLDPIRTVLDTRSSH